MMRKWLYPPVLLLLLAAATGLTLAPGLHSWYVADDFLETGYVQGSPSPWDQWTHPYIGRMVYRPLTIVIYYYSVYFLDPLGHHLLDWALHALNCGLLFLLLRKLWPPEPEARPETPAFIGALFYAVHPLAANTAAWLACRADLTGTACALMAMLAAASRLRPGFRLPLIALPALAAVLIKESQFTVALAVLAVAYAAAEGNLRARLRAAALAAAPAVLVTAAALIARWRVIGGLGSYELVAPGLAANLASLAWHLPRLFDRAFTDFFFHHFGAEPLATAVKAGLIGLILLAGPAALRRQGRLILLGFVLTLVYLMPVWNMSHMMVIREDRLLYSALLGMAMVVAAVVGGARHPVLRAGAVAAALTVCLGLGLWSRAQVAEWNRVGDGNLRLARALAGHIKKAANARRFYVLGLPPEHYYLDNMVKLELPDAFVDRLVLTGDQAGFFWQPSRAAKAFDLPDQIAEPARPERLAHRTVPGMIMETVTPPDLVTAAGSDPAARVLFWDGRTLRDWTDRFRQLQQRREYIRRELAYRPNLIPSFGFHLCLIPLGWTLAPGLTATEPDEMLKPYLFTAADHDPWMVSPPLKLITLGAGRLTVAMTLPPRSYLPPGEDQGCLVWRQPLTKTYGVDRSACFPIIVDGREHEYALNLDRNPWWPLSGTITSLRLDPVAYPTTFQIDRMEFFSE